MSNSKSKMGNACMSGNTPTQELDDIRRAGGGLTAKTKAGAPVQRSANLLISSTTKYKVDPKVGVAETVNTMGSISDSASDEEPHKEFAKVYIATLIADFEREMQRMALNASQEPLQASSDRARSGKAKVEVDDDKETWQRQQTSTSYIESLIGEIAQSF